MSERLGVLLLTAALLAGCHHHPRRDLTPVLMQPEPNCEGREKVKIAKSDPPDDYTEVGALSVVDGSGCNAYGQIGNFEEAIAALKNNACTMGADYVQILAISEPYSANRCIDTAHPPSNEYRISGTAFKAALRKGRDVKTELRELENLLKDGVISQKEFEELKSRVMNRH